MLKSTTRLSKLYFAGRYPHGGHVPRFKSRPFYVVDLVLVNASLVEPR